MTSMVEKMADAMRRDYGANPLHCWEERARAALNALLEPDAIADNMAHAGACAGDDVPHYRDAMREQFRAMIQAALASQEA